MSLGEIEKKINEALIRDRFRLSGRLRNLDRRRRDGKPIDRGLAKLRQDIETAVGAAKSRLACAPLVKFDLDLPILEKRQEIVDLLCQRQVLVICGETGSGKSTQLPKICLQAGRGRYGMIGHSQPRRIAARSIATRIAEELAVPLGREVGFKIRFTDRTYPGTFVKLMTDGILLAETQHDRYLENYDTIILDEAHERSLNIDFLLGYLKRIASRRSDLKVIITSATIDATRFSEHFQDQAGPAPIVGVSGRTYPVEVRYREPPDPEDDGSTDELDQIADAVHELAAIDRGHILVFLPTERDIREVAKRLRHVTLPGDGSRRTEILPLYARLSAKDQARVFESHSYRRIVLATNVAESSLTVPGIRYVVDTGTARISRYSPRSKVQRLPIEPVSRASADQRKGRCGRIAPGICIRLYSEADFQRRDEYTTPEIRRTNLASVILRAKALKLGSVDAFPFLDPPRAEAIRDGFKTLFEIGAVDSRGELSATGRRLAQVPVDPRIGRMILASENENCLSEMLIIASALEIQDPRERPHEKKSTADEAHARFHDDSSDFLSLLKVWDFFHELKESLSRSKLRKACQQNFLSWNRLREWTEIHRQLSRFAADAGLKRHARSDDYAGVHRALLTGLLSGIAYRSGDFEYTGAGGVKFHLWPGSGLFKKRPKWIVVGEIVETSRRYGRNAARISPDWLEPLAEHLVKRSYSEPHWSRKRSTVMAYEKVNLFGLPIVVRRRVRYVAIDPAKSRELFIRDGLVPQRVNDHLPVLKDHAAVREAVASLAAKTRQARYVVDDYTVLKFYDERIPECVCDVPSLRKWMKENPVQARQHLQMRESDLVGDELDSLPRTAFPEELKIGEMRLPLTYHFEPGSEKDGVTLTVPADGVRQVQAGHLGWLVPGLVEEKIVALIRSLPKSIRRNLVPAPDTAREVIEQIDFATGDFLPTVARKLSQIAGESIPVNAFRLDKLPDHLRMNVEVVDHDGTLQVAGRDLDQVQSQVGSEQSDNNHGNEIEHGDWHRDQLTSWDMDDFPEQIVVTRAGIDVPTFPALIDQHDHVNLRLLGSASLANQRNRAGIRRLYVIAQRRALKSQIRWLPRWDEICLFASSITKQRKLESDVRDLIADRAFLAEEPFPRSRSDFESRLENSAERIGLATQDVAKLLPRIFEGYHRARMAWEAILGDRFAVTSADIEQQMRHLVFDGFLLDTPWIWLNHLPRYLDAICYRLDRLSGALARDQEAVQELESLWHPYARQLDANQRAGRCDEELTYYRWMLEEYRVSRFAQPLGTAFSVSDKRLEKQWAKVNPS